MKRTIDIDAILAPLPGENPAGENLRYAPIYDEIKEARRADDPFDRGDWDREIKTSDWDKVIALSVKALSEKTKDLQIAAWLTEALTRTEGFKGFALGLKILNSFLGDLWDHAYPEIDEGDLEYRVGPLEFLNNNLWLSIRGAPITDNSTTSGYSWIKWQESRQVGYEKDTLNQYGDVDDSKKAARDEKIAEGKLTAEAFDTAVTSSSKRFYVELEKALALCLDEFKIFDEAVDEKFGNEAPRLFEIRQALEDCEMLLSRILKEKGILKPEPQAESDAEPVQDAFLEDESESASSTVAQVEVSNVAGQIPSDISIDFDSIEQAFWRDALINLQESGIREALGKLLNASCSAPSVRQQNRYRLLMAKLCLRADRPDLARPIVEELHTLIEQMNLEQWESPIWIAEILDAYYQCLTAEGASDDDLHKANNELFQRLCTTDITKAITYKG